jgi:hypothetical protein
MKGKALTDQEKARGKFLACLFLNGADRERFKQVVNNLNNDFILGKISYPEDAAGMLHLLSNHRGNSGGPSKQLETLQDGVISTSFTQTGATAKNKQNRKCNYCKMFGHLEENCRKKVADEAARANGLHVQNQTKNSRWFSSEEDRNVTGFQYDQYEARAWFEDEDD